MYVANPRGLDRMRPIAPWGYYLYNFAVLCPMHGMVKANMPDFDTMAVVFANHALAFHTEVDAQLEIQWSESRIPGDDYCI